MHRTDDFLAKHSDPRLTQSFSNLLRAQFAPFQTLQSSPSLSGDKLFRQARCELSLTGSWLWCKSCYPELIWPVVASGGPAPQCGEDKKLCLTPPSSLLVSPGESELWPRDGSDCPTKTDRRSQWSCCNVKCFMWRKSDPPARPSWRVNYSWNGLLEQILFSRVVAGADEPGLQCDYLQSKPDNCWLEGNEKLILLEFCWKKFR